jgi:hypothetical protein
MKPRHAFGLVGALVLLAAAASCNQPQRRNDWRSPAPHLGTPPNERPPFTPTDGGAPENPPPGSPNVQPAPGDIQI